MAGQDVLVTGASGFIGNRLVNQLVSRGDNVKCLARQTSDISRLKKLDCSIVFGDTVGSPESVVEAVANVDRVYHLAASTHAIHSRELVNINTAGLRNVLNACESRASPPEIVFVSSLAAVGPSAGSRLHVEEDANNPVSNYGRSKAACEVIAREHANRLPISIVRPPIVLGGGDRHGLELFRLIDQWGWHLVPGFSSSLYSVIHVDDLVTALIAVGERGKRLSVEADTQGVYFASSYETFTYVGLGKIIGKALGRKRTRVLRVAKPCMWAFVALNEIKARITGSPQFLNLDKYHEAFAGSWACSSLKLRNETGFSFTTTMLSRLEQTVAWYRNHGWLSEKQDQHHSKQRSMPTRKTPAAVDALQTALIPVLEKRHMVQQQDSPESWLFPVALNEAMPIRRKASISHKHAENVAWKVKVQCGVDKGIDQRLSQSVHHAIQQEDIERVREALARLPERQREVVQKRIYEGLKFREIAVELDVPLGTVLARMQAALKKLKPILTSIDEDRLQHRSSFPER